MVVFQKFYRVQANLCRDHGVETAKKWLGQTVVQGWWGITSFFFNWAAVATDVSALMKVRKLDTPQVAPPAEPPPTPPMPAMPDPSSEQPNPGTSATP
jgi:hypothetical protein